MQFPKSIPNAVPATNGSSGRRQTMSTIEESHKCPYCSQSHMAVALLFDHMQIHKSKGGLLKCTNCLFSSSKPLIMFYHIKNKHIMQRMSLPVENSSNFGGIRRVSRRPPSSASSSKSSPSLVFKSRTSNHCPFCTTACATQKEALQHYGTHRNSNGLLVCKICDYQTASDVFFFYHNKGHLENYKAKCNKCDFECYDSLTYSRHKKSLHQGEEGVAAIVTKDQKSKRVPIANPTRIEGKTGLQGFCFICKASITPNKQMLVHLEENHKRGGEFKCSNCLEFKTGSAILFQGHLKECSTSCKKCGKIFTDPRIFVDHLKSHLQSSTPNASISSADKVKCQFCDKFLAPQSIDFHVKYKHPSRYQSVDKVTTVKKIVSKAKKSFNSSHSKLPKPSKCYFCDKVSPSVKKMLEHLVVHRREDGKLYCVYPGCDSKHSAPNSLYVHILTKHLKNVNIKQENSAAKRPVYMES